MPTSPKPVQFFLTGVRPEHEVRLLLAGWAGVPTHLLGYNGLVLVGPPTLKKELLRCLDTKVRCSTLGPMVHLAVQPTRPREIERQLAQLRRVRTNSDQHTAVCTRSTSGMTESLSQAFAALAERILGPIVQQQLRLTGPHNGEYGQRSTPSKFTIFLGACPPGNQPSDDDFEEMYTEDFPLRLLGVSARSVIDLLTDSGEEFTFPTTTGWPITPPESSQHIVAQLINKNALYVLLALGRTNDQPAEQVAIFRHILFEVAAYLLAQQTLPPAPTRNPANTQRDQYAKLRRQGFYSIDRAAAQGLRISRELVDQLQRDLTAAVELLERCQSTLLVRSTAVPLHQEYDRLLATAKVQRVEITDRVVHVFTDTIHCTDPRDDVVHELGRFRIDVYLHGTIRWHNLDRQVDGFHAPHVKPTGEACLGNMADIIPQLIAKREFTVVATLAIAFVESVNINDGWGKNISQWPVAKLQPPARTPKKKRQR